MKTRSGLRASLVMTLWDKKEERSAFNKQSENEENVLARRRRTELWCQVYRPSSRYDLQLETICWIDLDCRQNEHADDWEMDHLQRFFFVARVLFRYLIEKLKLIFGMRCSIDQRLWVLELAWVRMQEMTNPYDLRSCVVRLSLSFWMAVRTCFEFFYWPYLILHPKLVLPTMN